MKQVTNILAYAAVAGILIFTSCNKGSSNKKETEAKPITQQLSNANEVLLDTATAAIRRYGNFWRAQPNSPYYIDSVTRAFKIDGTDLIGVLKPLNGDVNRILNECTYSSARAYLGMDADNKVHLYFTPVDSDGNDVILTNNDGKHIVFDLTSPCPNTCDASSPLYQAFDQQ